MHVSDYLRFGLPDEQPRASCPECGFEGPIDTFDVLGMDDGHILCNNCGNDFPWTETREKIQRLLF
jgi:hypothetical protein